MPCVKALALLVSALSLVRTLLTGRHPADRSDIMRLWYEVAIRQKDVDCTNRDFGCISKQTAPLRAVRVNILTHINSGAGGGWWRTSPTLQVQSDVAYPRRLVYFVPPESAERQRPAWAPQPKPLTGSVAAGSVDWQSPRATRHVGGRKRRGTALMPELHGLQCCTPCAGVFTDALIQHKGP